MKKIPKKTLKTGPKAAPPALAPKGLLSEITAAIEFEISPELLRYFTSHSVKHGETRVLPVTTKGRARFYDPEDLKAYDSYLRAPWPKTAKQSRPHLPDEIRQDIMREAHFACAVCAHNGAGEAAHLVPVAKAHSHHPAVLLWLCANHHTGVDKGKPPIAFDLAQAKWLKAMLVERRMRLWSLEHATHAGLLQLMQLVEAATDALKEAEAKGAYAGVAAIAQIDLDALSAEAAKVIKSKPALGPTPAPAEKATLAFATTIKAKINKVKVADKVTFAAATEGLAHARFEFLQQTGQINCPVCKGSGLHAWAECIPCQGSGAMDQNDAAAVNLSDYRLVKCPVCKGKGTWKNEDCPACSGQARVQQFQADQIDPDDFAPVDCPLCVGAGVWGVETCPICQGQQKLERRQAEQVQLDRFAMVDCPLCEIKRTCPGEDCSFCNGQGQVEGFRAEQFDPNDYKMLVCKLCKGRGHWRQFDECPGCGGNGELGQADYDRVDWGQYDLVDCPRCNGKGSRHGDECQICGGEGAILSMHRDQLS